MTPIQQQRLVGLGLLLLLIGIVAYFLISSANQNHQELVERELNPDDNFASLVEPLDEQVIDEFLLQEEALVDPHKLTDTEPAEGTPLTESKPNNSASAHKTAETKVNNKVVEVKQADTSEVLKSETVERWTAQLASFSSKANAEALADKVKGIGYEVELLTGKTNNKTIYRVRLQSETNKLSIEKKAETLKKTIGLKPQVFRVNN